MKENETLLNQFIANVAFHNVVTIGALHYATLIYFEWTRSSMVLRIAFYNRYNLMNLRIGDISIFDYIILASILCTCISIAVRGSGRIRYNDMILDKEQRKKDRLAGKKIPAPKDILSIRFGDQKQSKYESDDEDSDSLL